MAAVTPDEIERKLEQLRRMAGVEPPTHFAASEAAHPEAAPTAPPHRPPEASLPAAELAELGRLVGRMETAAATFTSQVGALSDHLAEIVAAFEQNGQPQQVAAPAAPSAAGPDVASEPVVTEAESEAASTPLRDEVEIEAGPFGDIIEVSSFVQSLAEVEGVNDVYVRGFESANALLEVRLQAEVDLADALLEAMPGRLELRAIDDARVSVAINAGSHAAAE
jgi:hypothetical protein